MDTEIYSKRLSVSDKELLLRYLAKAYPFRTDLNAFIDFTLSYVPKEGMEKSLLIFKGKEIIGANMFLQTKAKIGKTEYDIVWSYDTKVLDEYRKTEAGTIICGEIFSNKNSFGAGLSGISVELNKRMHAKFIAKSLAFIRLNRYLFKYIFALFCPSIRKPLVDDSSYPREIKTRLGLFRRLEKAIDLNQPRGNYWNDNLIEFERSTKFLDWRFFTLKDKYQVYALRKKGENDVYFACRQYDLSGIPLLYVVDYRFLIDDFEEQKAIIKAALLLSRKMKFAGVYIRSSLPGLSKLLKNNVFIMKKGGDDIVTRFKPAIQEEYSVFHTPADSDMDFK